MKNKSIYFIFIIPILLFKTSILLAEPFNIQAEVINFQDSTNLLIAKGSVQVVSDNGIIINGDQLEYNKLKKILKMYGNITLKDEIKNLVISGKEIVYEKLIEKISFNDKIKINFNEKYFLDAEDVVYLRNSYNLTSKKNATLKDIKNNLYKLNSFSYFTNTELLKSNGINLIDSEKNQFRLNQTFIDLKNDRLLGKDLEVNLNNKSFNSENDPRLKGSAISIENNVSTISNGIFTTCKKNDACPPWTISAKKITHNKEKKRINYKNAWFKIYDQPVLYFPKFFHPDPTVKRQSGFLIPTLRDSTNFGLSLTVPYYKVISDSKDFTLRPRIFADGKSIIQTEYREVTKNSEHVFDFSFGNLGQSKSHFFSKSEINLDLDFFDESTFKINIEQTSNNNYIKNYSLKSPLIDDVSKLESFINLTGYKDDMSIDVSAQVFENLSKGDTDKYEYIFPTFTISKLLNFSNSIPGSLEFKSSGYKKLYDTNVEDNVLINDLNFESNTKVNFSGLKSNYKFLLKNVNTKSKNSTAHKNKLQNNLESLFLYETKYPLKKESLNSTKYFTPIMQIRFSPNSTKNMSYDDVEANINNIFSFNRIGVSDGVEGGESLTLGSEYRYQNKIGEEIVNLSLGSVFRLKENADLAYKTTLGNTSSNIIGNLKLNPNKYIEFDYDFSLDNSLDRSNYDLIKAEFSVNNFVTSFEYFQEQNQINKKSYIYNKTKYNFDNKNSVEFSTRENKITDLTEFYNLIYEYQNDCLKAALEYKKDFYTDVGLKPEEQLFFSITIMPFGKINSQNLQ